jgi:hypothetical protein
LARLFIILSEATRWLHMRIVRRGSTSNSKMPNPPRNDANDSGVMRHTKRIRGWGFRCKPLICNDRILAQLEKFA